MNPFLFPYIFGVLLAFGVYLFFAYRLKQTGNFFGGKGHEESKQKKSKGKVQLVKVEDDRKAQLEAELFNTKAYEVEKRKKLLAQLKELGY